MTAVLAPPGPRGHLIAGNLPEFRQGRLEFLTQCAREFGDFVKLRFGHRRIILVSDVDAIEHILLTDNHNFIKHFALRINPVILGNGLLTSEGDFWLRQRRLAQPAFGRNRISAYAPVMVEYARRLLDGWHHGQTLDLLPEMMRLTLEIAAKTLFDADAGSEASNVGDAMAVMQDAFVARFGNWYWVPLIIPTPGNLRFRRAARRLDEIIYGFIRQRRASKGEKSDLLSMLLNAQDTDKTRMTDKQLRDEAMTLFLAGHETTALTLAWTWYLLAQHPQATDRLEAELTEVLAGRTPTLADLPRLQFLDRVITESLRLYPPAYVIGREALNDCTIGGYPVKRGTTLLMSQWVMHRDPRYFDRPDEFLPDRWADGLAQRLPKYAYFPFGGGPRVCIGKDFALMETALIVATIAQKYRFNLEPGLKVSPGPRFTLRPEPGIRVTLEKR